MSQLGQSDAATEQPGPAMEVCTFPMPPGTVFDWHTHREHQLAWASSGVLTVRSGIEAWVLPPTRALWIPAGVRHETLSASTTTMRSAYVRPDDCPIGWTDCTPVVATPLMASLLEYLADESLETSRRTNAEVVLVDLLAPIPAVSVEVRMPTDDRARRVADLLAEDPSDDRTLADWGHDVGASSRTLARSFLSDTGLPFGRWRSLLRLRIAMEALAAGRPVASVASQVGYESSSAFVAAFRKETGITPAAYFRDPPSTPPRAPERA
ncbi:MAG TPA: helix-turn-helix transcriptional regulator [Acidimicrobiales bacterium]|nr:helix-turn-helix transcriptional regulator [Acidimicrobiales bacterium]